LLRVGDDRDRDLGAHPRDPRTACTEWRSMTTPVLHPLDRQAALRNTRLQADALRRISSAGNRTPFASRRRTVALADQAFDAILIADSECSTAGSNASRRFSAGQITIARQVS
jgi:hypothetical protein